MAKLAFPAEGGVRVEELEEQVLIGRHPLCDVQVRAPAASLVHCAILLVGDAWMLRDLGSLSGTFVSGRRVREHRLGHGDVLYLGGDVRCVFTEPDELPPFRGCLLAGGDGMPLTTLVVDGESIMRHAHVRLVRTFAHRGTEAARVSFVYGCAVPLGAWKVEEEWRDGRGARVPRTPYAINMWRSHSGAEERTRFIARPGDEIVSETSYVTRLERDDDALEIVVPLGVRDRRDARAATLDFVARCGARHARSPSHPIAYEAIDDGIRIRFVTPDVPLEGSLRLYIEGVRTHAQRLEDEDSPDGASFEHRRRRP
jgi:hypothetical protein